MRGVGYFLGGFVMVGLLGVSVACQIWPLFIVTMSLIFFPFIYMGLKAVFDFFRHIATGMGVPPIRPNYDSERGVFSLTDAEGSNIRTRKKLPKAESDKKALSCLEPYRAAAALGLTRGGFFRDGYHYLAGTLTDSESDSEEKLGEESKGIPSGLKKS